MLTYGMENQSIKLMHIWDTKQIETPQLRGLEVTPQLMRSETKKGEIKNGKVNKLKRHQRCKISLFLE